MNAILMLLQASLLSGYIYIYIYIHTYIHIHILALKGSRISNSFTPITSAVTRHVTKMLPRRYTRARARAHTINHANIRTRGRAGKTTRKQAQAPAHRGHGSVFLPAFLSARSCVPPPPSPFLFRRGAGMPGSALQGRLCL